MHVTAAFSVAPLGAGESVVDLVAAAVRVVRASGLPTETNAMFTNVEGEYDEVMAVIGRAVAAVQEGAPRVTVTIKLDVREVTDGLSGKVARLEEALGQDG